MNPAAGAVIVGACYLTSSLVASPSGSNMCFCLFTFQFFGGGDLLFHRRMAIQTNSLATKTPKQNISLSLALRGLGGCPSGEMNTLTAPSPAYRKRR